LIEHDASTDASVVWTETNASMGIEDMLHGCSNCKKTDTKISIKINITLYEYITMKNIDMVKILTCSMNLYCPMESIGP
jgi:hypothetical protein